MTNLARWPNPATSGRDGNKDTRRDSPAGALQKTHDVLLGIIGGSSWYHNNLLVAHGGGIPLLSYYIINQPIVNEWKRLLKQIEWHRMASIGSRFTSALGIVQRAPSSAQALTLCFAVDWDVSDIQAGESYGSLTCQSITLNMLEKYEKTLVFLFNCNYRATSFESSQERACASIEYARMVMYHQVS